LKIIKQKHYGYATVMKSFARKLLTNAKWNNQQSS